MEDKEIKTNLIVFITLLGLFSLIFFVSQTQENPGFYEKIMYFLSTLILFAYLGTAFMRYLEGMIKMAFVFSLISLLTIMMHLSHDWIPFLLKIIVLIISFFSFTLSFKLLLSRKVQKETKIAVIDQTSIKEKKKRKTNTKRKK